MDEQTHEAIRHLPRSELETFALRAAFHLREHREDAEAGRVFSALLGGFVLGALVASAAFVIGASLG